MRPPTLKTLLEPPPAWALQLFADAVVSGERVLFEKNPPEASVPRR